MLTREPFQKPGNEPVTLPQALLAGEPSAARREAGPAAALAPEDFRAFADLLPQIVWIASDDDPPRLLFVNARWHEYTGEPADAEPEPWRSVVHPDDRDALHARWTQARRSRGPFELEYRILGRDGAYRWHLGRSLLVEGPGGGRRWFGSATDIEDQKRVALERLALLARERAARAEAEEQRRRLQTVFAQAPVPVLMQRGPRHLIELANPAFRAAFTAGREVVGLPLAEAVPQAEANGLLAMSSRVLRTGEPFSVTGLPLHLAGEAESFWSFTVHPFRDIAGGEVEGVICVGADATEETLARRKLEAAQAERMRREQERAQLLSLERAARAEAETANRLKDEFLATLSHELRTPLNAVMGWTRMLRSGQLDEAARDRALETVERNARQQARLIEDIFDVSRIIAGKLRLSVREVDLAAVAAAVLDSLRPAAEAKGIVLASQTAAVRSGFVGDPDRLHQILWNLVSNAVKFTPKGGRVSVELAFEELRAELRVIDSGQGIAKEFLPHVFDRFRQADGTATRAHGGLGLGLSIVRHLVELHGGAATAQSDGPGKGATFVVTLPLQATAPEADGADAGAPPQREQRLAGTRVLVIDDDADSRSLIDALLSMQGAAVRCAASAPEGLSLLQAFRPDVLISDIGMPGEDGYELLREARALPLTRGGGVPAIALTAYAGADDSRRALQAGYQLHLPKPTEPEVLIDTVARLLGK